MRIKHKLWIFIALFAALAVFALAINFHGASAKKEETSYNFYKTGHFSAHIVPGDGQRIVQDIPALAMTSFAGGDNGFRAQHLRPITCEGAYFQKAPGILWICIEQIVVQDQRYKPADRTYQPDNSVGWFFTKGEIKDGKVTLENPDHFDAHCWVAYIQAFNLEDSGIVKSVFATLFKTDPVPEPRYSTVAPAAASPTASTPSGERKTGSDKAVQERLNQLTIQTSSAYQEQLKQSDEQQKERQQERSAIPTVEGFVDVLGIVLLGICAVGMYFLPTIIASLRKNLQAPAIFTLNLLLGWTFVGWVVALVWSLVRSSDPPSIANASPH
jgi:hypothetical protein